MTKHTNFLLMICCVFATAGCFTFRMFDTEMYNFGFAFAIMAFVFGGIAFNQFLEGK